MQHCTSCDHRQLYGRSRCTNCHADTLEWIDVSGLGTVYSRTVIRQNPTRTFRHLLPLVVALVDLDEGPRMMTNVVGSDPDDVVIGARVRVRFEQASDDAALPLFELDRDVSGAAPIRIGLLFDFPQHDGGDSFATAVELGLSTVALDRPVEVVRELAAGLPGGTAFDVEQKFAALERARCARGRRTVDLRQRLGRPRPRRRGRAAVHQLHGRCDHPQRVHVPLPGRLARRGAGCSR